MNTNANSNSNNHFLNFIQGMPLVETNLEVPSESFLFAPFNGILDVKYFKLIFGYKKCTCKSKPQKACGIHCKYNVPLGRLVRDCSRAPHSAKSVCSNPACCVREWMEHNRDVKLWEVLSGQFALLIMNRVSSLDSLIEKSVAIFASQPNTYQTLATRYCLSFMTPSSAPTPSANTSANLLASIMPQPRPEPTPPANTGAHLLATIVPQPTKSYKSIFDILRSAGVKFPEEPSEPVLELTPEPLSVRTKATHPIYNHQCCHTGCGHLVKDGNNDGDYLRFAPPVSKPNYLPPRNY